MAFRPKPVTYSCAKCGWKKTVWPKSDALRPGEFFRECPKCRGEVLGKKASVLESIVRKLLD